MDSREIRNSFLAYFEQTGHRVVPSSSLVPGDDPTLLFTNAGMNQFKDVFLGKERRDYRRAATSQKCMRVSGKHNDLDNVGPSLRHHTFFEMLGNFSFGDYFKAEAIELAWRLLTDVWKLPAERLHATVFGGEAGVPADTDARTMWKRFLPAGRILDLGLSDNFWQMGDTGPCGRCSEIHYFMDPGRPPTTPDADDPRYIEIWNNVFMEFDRQPSGELRPLPAPSIDTGMGLERITATILGVHSNYDTDLFQPILQAIGEMAGATYGSRGPSSDADVSMRVIADHVRATTFLIGDGVIPSNEWRGYVLRKIMRRAMRHGKKLGMNEPFLHRLVDVVVREMGGAYPNLVEQHDAIARTVQAEEARFDKVLTDGLPRLESALASASADRTALSGEAAFRLYDTYGLPFDFIQDIAGSQGVAVDVEGFERAMGAQRERARASSKFERGDELAFESEDARNKIAALGDRFEGYTTTEVPDATIVALFDDRGRQTAEIREEGSGIVLLDRTPFYLEAGGQVSDTGLLKAQDGTEATVTGMVRSGPGLPRGHRVDVRRGRLQTGRPVTALVDAARRDATRRNHSATHLLHAALRHVLGTHVRQAGSLVAPDRLRFDFLHDAPVTRDELLAIERMVNEQIWLNSPVQTDIRETQQALAAGAMALFGEKYGDRVRVVTMGPHSMELCGGTHCRATGDIGFFTITEESGVAAGVRRVEALTGSGALEHAQTMKASLDRLLDALHARAEDAPEVVHRLQQDVKRLSRDVQNLKVQAASGPQRTERDDAVEIDGIKVVSRRAGDLDKVALRTLADQIRDRVKSGVIVLASEHEGRVSLVVSVTPDLTARVKAGQIVKELAPIVGGRGGGRAELAEAGGKDPSKLDDLLMESHAVIRRLLST